jgi:hypothetical protein
LAHFPDKKNISKSSKWLPAEKVLCKFELCVNQKEDKRGITLCCLSLEIQKILVFSGQEIIKINVIVRYHTGKSMKLNARILHLAHMVYL